MRAARGLVCWNMPKTFIATLRTIAFEKLCDRTCERWCMPSKVSWKGIIVCGRTCHMIYMISHTLIHTLCLSKYAILFIKLSSDARNLQNLSLETQNLSVQIMPSVLTCAVITLCKHQPVSTMCECMAKEQSWNFCVKNQQVFVTSTCENRPYSYVVVMKVLFCDCAAQLSSYTTVLDHYKIVQSSKYFYIHQTCRYGQRYINNHQKRNKK